MSALQNLATTVAYEIVATEYRTPIQAAGLGLGLIDICMNDAQTPDALRRSLVRQLQGTMPKSVSASVRADGSTMPANEFPKHEARVLNAIFEQAHLSETLRPVVERDATGREQTSFYGKKSSWMNQYKSPPMLTKTIGGAPVKLPVIL